MSKAAFICFTKSEADRLVTALEVVIELVGNEEAWFDPKRHNLEQFYTGYEAADEFQNRIIDHFSKEVIE